MNLIPSPRPGTWRTASALLPAMVFVSAAGAELRLPAVISTGMVLQQKAAVPIWGSATPGETVTVVANWGDSGRAETRIETRADDEGQWRVTLSTPAAGGGAATLSVSTGPETIEISDVVMGEVWLCSGQSNMEWRVTDSLRAARTSPDLTPEKSSLDPARIRHFTVPKAYAMEPASTCGGTWLEAAGKDALPCSAAGYFFAQRLQEDLDVPIGLIVSSWGGTTAQVWTSAEVVSAFPDHAESLAAVRQRGGRPALSDAEIDAYWGQVDDEAFFARRFKDADFDDSHWDTAPQPASYASLGLNDFDGVVWYRTDVDVPPSWSGADLVLELPAIDDIDETFWNGERIGSLLTGNSWAQPRRYGIPAAAVNGGRASLVIRALDTGGRGGFGDGQMKLSNGEEWIDLSGEWRYRRGVSAERAGRPPAVPQLNERTPSALYNAMIAPLRPYGIRGVLWYQGESNRARAQEYQSLFPAMIVDWRNRWNDLELPFYFVQIAPYRYGEGEEGEEMTAQLREAQAKATRLPMTGMVLTADIGNPGDIHPKNKWEVGRRLALFALRDLYGRTDLEPDGPTFRSATRDGVQLVLSFDHVAGALALAGDSLEHFEVLNAEGGWVPANATITTDGQSIAVRANMVSAPKAARYLWSDAAESSVHGGTRLPMAPFKTPVLP